MSLKVLEPLTETKRIPIDKKKSRLDSKAYIALDDLDFSFYEWEIDKIISMWNAGESTELIIEEFAKSRDPDEIAILIIDLARKNKIKKRAGGVFGNEARKN